jgi:hypothetical protein
LLLQNTTHSKIAKEQHQSNNTDTARKTGSTKTIYRHKTTPTTTAAAAATQAKKGVFRDVFLSHKRELPEKKKTKWALGYTKPGHQSLAHSGTDNLLRL